MGLSFVVGPTVSRFTPCAATQCINQWLRPRAYGGPQRRSFARGSKYRAPQEANENGQASRGLGRCQSCIAVMLLFLIC